MPPTEDPIDLSRTIVSDRPAKVQFRSSMWSKLPKHWLSLGTSLLLGCTVALGVVVIRSLGGFQGYELRLYDRFIQLKPQGTPDDRLLIVGINEEDLTRYRWPLTDQILDQALATVEKYKPRAIGLDIFRDLPLEPGHAALQKRFQSSELITPVCKIGDSGSPGVAPPAGVSDDFVGFADQVIDPDGVVRRNLLYTTPSAGRCRATNALGLQLAMSYLAAQNIQPSQSPEGYPQLGSIVFSPLETSAGGYSQIDVRGYQIMLGYRSERHVAQTVSLADVLENKLKPDQVRDRVVLIGYFASSLKDTFLTPYNTGRVDQNLMPGVMIHAQSVSQILGAVLDGNVLITYWPEWAERFWILGWALVGSILARRLQNPAKLALACLVGVIIVGGSCYLFFLQGLWAPFVPAAIAIVFAGLSTFSYDAFQLQQQERRVSEQVQEQEKAISILQSLLQQTQATISQTALEQRAQPTVSQSSLLSNRYQLQKALGSGGFGQTFMAVDTKRPGKPICVVKWLRPARQDEQFMMVARRLFHSEAEILELLGQHERIPQLLAYFEEDNDFYMVQDFVPGHTLNDELIPGKPLKEAQAYEMVRGILDVLAFVHHHQVIHRDIKPANLIRRDSDRRIVLIDFGAVKQMQPGKPSETDRTVVIGTPGYAPPEQLRGQPNLSSDIYATGIIGIQALTGIAPTEFEHDPRTGELIWQHHAQVSPAFAHILDQMVRQTLANRYATATLALRDLDKVHI